MGDVIAEIRELHRPTGDAWLTCGGCDSEGWESEAPTWPCRTARLVYSPEEIARYEQEERTFREARRQQQASDPSPTAALIPNLWQQRLLDQITADTFLTAVLNVPRQNP